MGGRGRASAGLDAPEPVRFLAERSGSWRIARMAAHPDVAPMALDKNLGTLSPDGDTEDTPPTAVPGQFRFDDLDDDLAAPAGVGSAEVTYDDALHEEDDDPVLRAAEAEISAAREAIAAAGPSSPPTPIVETVPDLPPISTPAPAPAPTHAAPPQDSVWWLVVAVVVVGAAVFGAAQLF